MESTVLAFRAIARRRSLTVTMRRISLGADFPFFSAIVLFKNQPFPLGFLWFSRKKDPWKEWGSYPFRTPMGHDLPMALNSIATVDIVCEPYSKPAANSALEIHDCF